MLSGQTGHIFRLLLAIGYQFVTSRFPLFFWTLYSLCPFLFGQRDWISDHFFLNCFFYFVSISYVALTLCPLPWQQCWYGTFLRDLMAVIQAYFACTFNLERSQTGDRWDESQFCFVGCFGYNVYPSFFPYHEKAE